MGPDGEINRDALHLNISKEYQRINLWILRNTNKRLCQGEDNLMSQDIYTAIKMLYLLKEDKGMFFYIHMYNLSLIKIIEN